MAQDNATLTVGAEKYFHEQLAQGNFLIQRCKACSTSIFFPRMICPHCGSGDIEWYAPSGKGTVYATTIVRKKPEAGGDYNVALIDLEEGPRMMSRIEGIAPTEVKIGQKVQASVKTAEEGNIVIFTVAGE
ncbi:MAG: Zn-ribbon domain-containing OB-fold protein [Alcaligenaceae bacterium]|nr:Zn-ribbon domain-containing OB-fold protein [Alcaligenaceae bacterium]